MITACIVSILFIVLNLCVNPFFNIQIEGTNDVEPVFYFKRFLGL